MGCSGGNRLRNHACPSWKMMYRSAVRLEGEIAEHSSRKREAEAPSGAWMILLLDTGSQRCHVEVPSTQSC